MTKLYAVAGLTAVLISSLFNFGCGAAVVEENTVQLVSVKTVRAEVSNEQVSIEAPATIFPREQANVSSRITAPIRELGAQKGDRVARDQVLARLDNRDLIAQRLEIAALVKDAEASLEKMRSGTVPSDIEKAKGQVSTTEAALSQAEKFYERRKQLFDQGAIPNRDLLVSQTDLATAKTNHDVAQQALTLLQQQSSGKDIEILESRVEQARGKLAVIDTQIVFSTLRSPFAGTITEQLAFPGDMAQPSTTTFTVADLSVVVARAQVPESDAVQIRRGQPCRFTPTDREGTSFAGQVSVINEAVDPTRRTVEIWCEIPNGKGELRSQVFGSLQIVTGNLSQVVVVPTPAVQLDEGTRKGFVMVAGPENLAHKKLVETGVSVAARTPVLKGLTAGDMVIVEGAYGLADGASISVVETLKK